MIDGERYSFRERQLGVDQKRTVRSLLWILCPLCLVIGLGALGFGVYTLNDRLKAVGAGYLVVSGLTAIAAIGVHMSIRRKKSHHRRNGGHGHDHRSGMVLVLVLLLVGVLAVLTLNAQIATAGALRQSAARHRRMQLRIAAADAALAFMRDTAAGRHGGAANWTPPPPAELPSGIKTAIKISENTGLPETALMLLGGRGSDSRLFLVESAAVRETMSERVYCVVRRKTAGVEIIGWNQGI